VDRHEDLAGAGATRVPPAPGASGGAASTVCARERPGLRNVRRPRQRLLQAVAARVQPGMLQHAAACGGHPSHACPKSYCASSQCEQERGGYPCDLPCSPQEADVQCPAGQIPRFIKSFPTCPQHTPRYACKHFDRCERRGGEQLSLPPAAPSSPVVDATGFRRDQNGAAHRDARPGSAVLPLVLVWTGFLVHTHSR